MSDEEFAELLEVLRKISQLQVYTATKVTRLQAQVSTLQGNVKAMQANLGAPLDDLEKQTDEAFRKYDAILQDGLKSWLTDHHIAHPKADDPWWDRPQE